MGYFRVMGFVLISLVLIGFVSFSFVRPGGVTGVPLLLHLHGAVFLSWFILYITQTTLVARRNIALHRRLGQTSLALALAMVILAFVVMRGALANPSFSIAGMPPAASLMFPFSDIVNFSIVYLLALINRGQRDTHSRFMLLAGMLMIDPAVARIALTMGATAPVILVIELGLYASLFVYDFRTRGRPHWASVLGLGLYATAMAAKIVIAPGDAWASFVATLFGQVT